MSPPWGCAPGIGANTAGPGPIILPASPVCAATQVAVSRLPSPCRRRRCDALEARHPRPWHEATPVCPRRRRSGIPPGATPGRPTLRDGRVRPPWRPTHPPGLRRFNPYPARRQGATAPMRDNARALCVFQSLPCATAGCDSRSSATSADTSPFQSLPCATAGCDAWTASSPPWCCRRFQSLPCATAGCDLVMGG